MWIVQFYKILKKPFAAWFEPVLALFLLFCVGNLYSDARISWMLAFLVRNIQNRNEFLT